MLLILDGNSETDAHVKSNLNSKFRPEIGVIRNPIKPIESGT